MTTIVRCRCCGREMAFRACPHKWARRIKWKDDHDWSGKSLLELAREAAKLPVTEEEKKFFRLLTSTSLELPRCAGTTTSTE